MADHLKGLAVDGLVNAQATALVVDSELFRPLRERAAAANEELGDLVSCALCTGMWISIGQALAAELCHPPFSLPRFVRTALAVACTGRLVRRLTDLSL